MKQIELKEKTGFEIIDKNEPVIILDFRCKLFYDNSPLKKKGNFNLPNGLYYIESGNFKRLNNPIHFKLNDLPPPERNWNWPFDFEIKFGINKHKATIDWNRKTILFDNSFKSKSLSEIYFILFHEYAHCKFITELYVDKLAENMMLQHGFNPSQTGMAPIDALSSKQVERKIDSVERNLNR